MFITEAFAQAASTTTAQPGANDILLQLAPFALIFVILYFLIIRPQQRRLKEHQNMISKLSRGDVVVTSGGLIGKVDRIVDDNEVIVELSENTKVRVVRATISDVRSKTEPKATNENSKDDIKKSA